jgi:hypothetical protein
MGKPDYLLQRREGLIPVEVRPTRRAKQPYESDMMQLAAYCLLVEVCLGERPPYGLLRYANHTFRIDYDDALRDDALGDRRSDAYCTPTIKWRPQSPTPAPAVAGADLPHNVTNHYLLKPQRMIANAPK